MVEANPPEANPAQAKPVHVPKSICSDEELVNPMDLNPNWRTEGQDSDEEDLTQGGKIPVADVKKQIEDRKEEIRQAEWKRQDDLLAPLRADRKQFYEAESEEEKKLCEEFNQSLMLNGPEGDANRHAFKVQLDEAVDAVTDGDGCISRDQFKAFIITMDQHGQERGWASRETTDEWIDMAWPAFENWAPGTTGCTKEELFTVLYMMAL